jgi:gas vesicle structural protein
MVVQPMGGTALERRQETSSLADVVGTVLDKGVVIDVFARVSLVGIELLRVDARVVVASIETYLQFAAAANRLELGTREPEQLTDVVHEITEAGARDVAKGKTKGALEAGLDMLGDILKPEEDRDRERSPHRK